MEASVSILFRPFNHLCLLRTFDIRGFTKITTELSREDSPVQKSSIAPGGLLLPRYAFGRVLLTATEKCAANCSGFTCTVQILQIQESTTEACKSPVQLKN